MKSFNFSAPKLMTSLCLLAFVSLSTTKLQAQTAKHTTTFALWEVDDSGEPTFALWNKQFKTYYTDMSMDKATLSPTASFNFSLEKLSGGAYQVELNATSMACCKGSDNNIYHTTFGTSKDDVYFEEVTKDVFRIKFKDTGTYLTAAGNGELYGTTIKMGDHQLWMITGR